MSHLRQLFMGFALLSLPFQTIQAAPNNAQLTVWVNEAMVATYTYNHQNFLKRQKEIAKYFTSAGWIAYSTALNDSKLPDTVKKNAYFVSAVPTMPPEIKNLSDERWEATMPLLVVYKNPQYQQKQTLNVRIDFKSVPPGQGVRGLAILSLQSTVIAPPCQCPSQNKSNRGA